jgi:hypothetical protein
MLKREITRKQYNMVFGGQYNVVQRVINGVDLASYQALKRRTIELLEDCYLEIDKQLKATGYTGQIPKPDFTADRFDPFSKNWAGVARLFTDIGSLSEQAGIDFVHFLLGVMIKAQEFSNSIPTVGGEIHIGALTKSDKFRWISPEEFTFEGKRVPRFTK